jgi:hypothetical protein
VVRPGAVNPGAVSREADRLELVRPSREGLRRGRVKNPFRPGNPARRSAAGGSGFRGNK